MDALGLLLVGLVMAVGLAGVVVPLLPGTALILAAGATWAVLLAESGVARWVVLAGMTALFLAGLALKYALPGRRLAGRLPRRTLLYAGAGALVGLLALPPLGLLLGGVAGTYLAERTRLGNARQARTSTVGVLRAVGVGLLAELTAGVLMIAVWLLGVLVA